MKLFSAIQKNKYAIVVVLFFITAAACIWLLFQSFKKDYSYQLFKQKMEYQEQARQAVIKERMAWEQLALQQTKQIIAMQVKDSVTAAHANEIANKIQTISTPTYVKQKIAPIADYSDADLQQYFNALPATAEPNDY